MRGSISTIVKKYIMLFFVTYLLLCGLAATEKWQALHAFFVNFFIMFSILLIIRQVFLIIFSLLNKTKNIISLSQPYVSIIVPAYNEEVVILDSLNSILDVNYNNYEVIVVDDGSTDNTLSIIKGIFEENNRHIPNFVISQKNAGKSNALNTGLMHSSGDYILCVDADSKLNKDCLLNGVHHFDDPEVGAIAGNVTVGNEKNWLTKFQQLEYLISQNFTKRALAWFGVVTIIPGPIGLFRRSAIFGVNGYKEEDNLFAEDADLSFRLLASGWKIKSEEAMLAETEAPNNIFSFLRQRYRWKRGIYQALNNNFMSLITSSGYRGSIITMIIILENFLFDIIGFGLIVFIVVNMVSTLSLHILLLWMAIIFFMDFLILLVSVPVKKTGKWFVVLLFQKVTYSYILQVWGILSLFDEWISTRMSWDKIKREGISSQ